MPELNWIGKQHVVNHAEEVPFRLLRKERDSSEGVADSGNMVVHGDNLEALKALLPYYRNRVKLVFIDPPYNTGNEGWAYNDKMNAPKLKKWFGKVVGGEGEDLSRHDKWLCMMYPRLELLRDLLAEDGSLWMTVDDNEAHVYTSAEEFGKVLKAVIKGMEENGYGKDEIRVKDATGKADPYVVTMKARHEGLSVPLVAVEDAAGARRELRYVQDLLGPEFGLKGLGFEPSPLNDPLAEKARVDVAEDASFETEMLAPPAKFPAGNGASGGTREDLVGWLLNKIGAYKEVADQELLGYVELAVDELLKTHPLDLLHRARYQIRDQMKARLDGHYLAWAKERYEQAKASAGEKRLVADAGVAFEVPNELRLPASLCGTSYRNSVFEHPGKFNVPEAELATDLDGLENLRCWYRNADKGEFALQGHRRAKFNPDFVAFTGSGKVVVLEYKGENLVSNEDTLYKEALGNDWAALDPDNRYFRVVGKEDVQEVLREVAKL